MPMGCKIWIFLNILLNSLMLKLSTHSQNQGFFFFFGGGGCSFIVTPTSLTKEDDPVSVRK